MKKVLVIGLDGATFDNLKPWIKEGKLPNFADIMENGVHGILKSTIPVLSYPAWTSFFTGDNVGKHGIFDSFIPQSDYSKYAVDSTNRKSKPIWLILSNANRKVVIINVPNTYPPDSVNGFMITGMGTPRFEENATVPRSLWKEISSEVPSYNVHVTGDFFYTGDLDKLIKNVFLAFDAKAKVVKYLMDKKEWDFFTILFHELEFIQHFLWKYFDVNHPNYNSKEAMKYGDTLYRCYQKIDHIIGEILNRIDEETTLIIASDHGFRSVYKGVYITNWLIEKKLLKLKTAKKRINIRYLLIKTRFIYGWLITKYGLKRLTKYIPMKIKKKVFLSLNINWPRTKVYFTSTGGQYLNINLKGRESQGIVEPGREYEELRDFIISELKKLQDPETGEKVIDKVYKREEIYSGPLVKKAPDLFILTKKGYHLQEGIGREGIFDTLRHPISEKIDISGTHEIRGILLMKGPNIKKGIEIKNANIIDGAPTILYTMGVPIPHSMDGKIIIDAFEASFLKENSIKYQDAKTGRVYSK